MGLGEGPEHRALVPGTARSPVWQEPPRERGTEGGEAGAAARLWSFSFFLRVF